jgi:hypothetical protein
LTALLGLAIIAAVFAGIYYAEDNLELRTQGGPAYHLAPGEAKSTQIQPAVKGTSVVVEITVAGGPVDIYVLEEEWARSLPHAGGLDLSRPFSYQAATSQINRTGFFTFSLISDGRTAYNLVMDNSDNFYEGDAVPDPNGTRSGTVSVHMTARYLESEQRSLVLGYLAAIPSVLLVGIAIGRKWRRHWKKRHPPRIPPE